MNKLNHHHHKHKVNQTLAHQTFVHSAAMPAQQSETLTGVPASITIAQAILESTWGTHHIGSANNYFGVKAHTAHGKVTHGTIATGHVDAKTREHIKGKDVTITAHFRKYKSMANSFTDHGNFLKDNKRYQKIIESYAKDGNANAFARGLQKAGYATDPDYASKLINIMKKNDLYKYNNTNKQNIKPVK